MKMSVWEFLSWVFAILALVLVLWRAFGNSPSEWAVAAAVISVLVAKVVGLSERVVGLEAGMKHGFYNVKKDMNLINMKIEGMGNKVDLIGEKLEVKI